VSILVSTKTSCILETINKSYVSLKHKIRTEKLKQVANQAPEKETQVIKWLQRG